MRLINADALMEDIEQTVRFSCRDGVPSAEMRGANKVIDRIEVAPTISPDDVRGVGKWNRISGFHLDHEYYPARYQCDQCKHFVDSGDDRNYCPNCGARMKGDNNGTTD